MPPGADDARAEGDRAGLEWLLGTPEMRWLVQRIRSRIPASDGTALTGVVRLRDPSPAQRAATTALVGRPSRPGASLSVDLTLVERILRRGPWPAGLQDAVVTLTGPVVDRKSQRATESAAWDRAVSRADHQMAPFPGLSPWWHEWCAAGGLKRTARSEASRTGREPGPDVADALVRSLAGILDALPGAGVPLSVFARQVTGDAHGLDASRPLGRLAVAVVGNAYSDDRPSETTISARDAWARAGVVLSPVSSTVLALGVGGAPHRGHGLAAATASALEAMRSARAPMLLTLDQVRSGGVTPQISDRWVHVCENPTVVEVAAARWAERGDGDLAPVLVCTSGQPSTAAVELLEILASHGARCRYHGDFDWAGLRIAHGLLPRVPWWPWRFTAEDYRFAVDRGGSSLALTDGYAEAPWDPDLPEAMAASGKAIEEEAVADLLAEDLLTPDDQARSRTPESED